MDFMIHNKNIMNVLIIGGTRFQGPHLIRDLLKHGHTVTIFHRGQHPANKNLQIKDILGDRDSPHDLFHLKNFSFDICIDTCAYHPMQIEKLAQFLKVDRYVLISSVYAYEDKNEILHEDCQLNSRNFPDESWLETQKYGYLKALCEIEAIKHFGNHSLLIRPSPIIGHGDHTERLRFWFRMTVIHHLRFDFSYLSKCIQLIDVRDLSCLVVDAINQKRTGAVNACGECIMLNDLIIAVTSYDTFNNKSKLALKKHLGKNLQEKLPFCDFNFYATYSNQKSKGWGFNYRSLQESLDDFNSSEKGNQFSLSRLLEQETLILRLINSS